MTIVEHFRARIHLNFAQPNLPFKRLVGSITTAGPSAHARKTFATLVRRQSDWPAFRRIHEQGTPCATHW
jgi:hypothetical protein